MRGLTLSPCPCCLLSRLCFSLTLPSRRDGAACYRLRSVAGRPHPEGPSAPRSPAELTPSLSISTVCRCPRLSAEAAATLTARNLQGDILLGINGQLIAGRSMDDIKQVVVGPVGTPVELFIQRGMCSYSLNLLLCRRRADSLLPPTQQQIQ